MTAEKVPIESVEAAAYTIPNDAHESDGTLQWDSVTCVVAHVSAGGHTGIGYSYTDRSAAVLIRSKLADAIVGRDALQTGDAWAAMVGAIRNLGRPGVASTAISAVDIALWDLKGRVLGAPVTALLGTFHDKVEVYGSGGFTSYAVEQVCDQLAGWVEQGIPRVKMKVGRDTAADPHRVSAVRAAVGDDVELYVDANGAWTRKQALAMAWRLAEADVRWLEEPVTSDDPEGLRLLRDRGPGLMDIAAGEYGYDLPTFRDMLAAGAVDCLQADVTRCGGITGFQRVGALCDAHTIDLSAHCAPSVSAHACAAQWHVRHIEYFHDHVRVERMLFDGRPDLVEGCLVADRSRPGLGLELRTADAEAYLVSR